MIDSSLLLDLTRRVDRNLNRRIDTYEGRVDGLVGNDNGVAGTRETADAITAGDAVLSDFALGATDAKAVSTGFARGDAWVSKDDLLISQRARDHLDGMNGAVDGRISAKELAAGLQRGGLALAQDGLYLSSEVRQSRPTPPSVEPDRPTPPSMEPDRPTPPSVEPGRPTPPSVEPGRPTPPSVEPGRPTPPSVEPGRPTPPAVPRYYWQPTFPIVLPTDRRQIPQIAPPPSPASVRKVAPGEVSADPFALLAESGRLRKKAKFLWIFTYYPRVGPGEARSLLQSGTPIFVSANGGFFGGSRLTVTDPAGLDPFVAEQRDRKYRALQDAENNAYENRLTTWRETDLQNRVTQLPPFNALYDMDKLNLANMMVSEGGRQFSRNLITAMNVYNQADTRRQIAAKWQENPALTTAEFNRMANSMITRKLSALYWDARQQGDWGTYLGTNPVPGLRYPDTPEDVEYNTNAIRRVAVEAPILLNGATLA